MERRDISKTHSIMPGFDLVPAERASFPFPALTYYAERPADRTAYITLFPIGQTMRANLCVYREMDDPWLRQFRDAPRQTLMALMPGLAKITGAFEVSGAVKIRPADLYVTTGWQKPGVVLVGDAFSTSCPAAGTGTGKVFTDVERLCNVHIPRWFATQGMGADKIAAFYADPAKRAYDAHSAHKAFHVRSLSIDPGAIWAARRWMRFTARLASGMLRQARGHIERPRLRLLRGLRPREGAVASRGYASDAEITPQNLRGSAVKRRKSLAIRSRYPAFLRAAGFAVSLATSFADSLPFLPAIGSSISRWPSARFLPFFGAAAFAPAAAFAGFSDLPD